MFFQNLMFRHSLSVSRRRCFRATGKKMVCSFLWLGQTNNTIHSFVCCIRRSSLCVMACDAVSEPTVLPSLVFRLASRLRNEGRAESNDYNEDFSEEDDDDDGLLPPHLLLCFKH